MRHDFTDVTETPNTLISQKQFTRMIDRYSWSALRVEGLDVVEVACGVGQGLGLLAQYAKSIEGCDISETLVTQAQAYYGNRVRVRVADAECLPYADNSLDCVIIHEALYYIKNKQAFAAELNRVLRPKGKLLLTTANKDIKAFHKSKYSSEYLGSVELTEYLSFNNFRVSLWGYEPDDISSLKNRFLNRTKIFLGKYGLLPETMTTKMIFRRLLQGKLLKMPNEIPQPISLTRLEKLPLDIPCADFKILFCEAIKND